jgi:hypothetical protein
LRARPLVLYFGFAAICLAVYFPALDGAFVGDDFLYLVTNPYTASLGAANLADIWDPFGEANPLTGNYAPVTLCLHALQIQLFGPTVAAYHVTNVLLHALNAALLLVLLRRSGVPDTAALLGATLFALHPANVEVVAWISQLKSGVALALALAALLALRRWPVASAVPFALSLLAKGQAVFALPFAAGLVWARGGARGRDWIGVGAWLAAFALFVMPQLAAFDRGSTVEVAAYDALGVHARSIAAIGSRYLAMAATSYGVSALHEPEPARSVVDGWWLAALPLAGLIGWRLVATLNARSEEAAWWLGALAAFAPVSQVIPLTHAIADRYLYFVLPGLIGALSLALVAAQARLPPDAKHLTRVAAVAACALAIFFAVNSHLRATVWRSDLTMLADAAAHYPEGSSARYLEGLGAASRGDVTAGITALRAAVRRGIDPRQLVMDPRLRTLHGSAEYRAFAESELALWLEDKQRRDWSSPAQRSGMARVQIFLGRYDEAIANLEQALEQAGPLEPALRADLAEAERARRAASGR